MKHPVWLYKEKDKHPRIPLGQIQMKLTSMIGVGRVIMDSHLQFKNQDLHNSNNDVYVMYTWATETAFKCMLNVLPQKMA